ncbi:hypothetical protein DNTS_029770 [Danionella cerebrum]|uniref:C2H2-type domain-containing protein n=1 Tax=Danionella cerebrum TaxID=2873325 RepID=A0A553QR84_9TELE|nr:hypothetical protein DNTS_029770 [Danionella translucida]TRY92296.1 hypothetical protein DNTS_029770 [Danionella translucida]
METTGADAAQTDIATFSKDHLDPETGVHSCEFCGTTFETRRGFSSHARSHLRLLGVAMSDSSGAPIDLLYQVMKERGGTLPKVIDNPTPLKKAPVLKKEAGPKLKIKISNLVKKKYALSSSLPSSGKKSVPGHASGKPGKVLLKKKVTPTPVSSQEAFGSKLGDGSLSTPLSHAPSKPLWAPQETDAPLILSTMKNSRDMDDDNVCELCGAWYETHKALSSHARSHLRQFGVNFDSKSAPIEILHEFIHSDDFQKKASAWDWGTDFDDWMSLPSTPSTSKNHSSTPLSINESTSIRLTALPAKKKKSSLSVSGSLLLKAKLKSHPKVKKKKITLGSSGNMALSDQMDMASPPYKKKKQETIGVSEILPLTSKAELTSSPSMPLDLSEPLPLVDGEEVKSSTVKKHVISLAGSSATPLGNKTEMNIGRQGVPARFIKCEYCPESFKKISSMASHARYHLRQMGISEWYVKGSPIATLREVMSQRPFTHLSSRKYPSLTPVPPSEASSAPSLVSTPEPVSPPSSLLGSPKVPKAKKGFSTVIPKLKDEPVETDIFISESTKQQSASSTPSGPSIVASPVIDPNTEPQEPVSCDYCGEIFSTRKALSCHARSHLKQLGGTWSLKYPPIEALSEIMKKGGSAHVAHIKSESNAGAAASWKKKAPSPQAFPWSPPVKDTSALDKSATGCDATCELCGFDFENRKALASHARAHLRQQGVDWKIIGSPIETLSEWMKKEPGKVAELHKSYMRGKLPLVKKGPRKRSRNHSSSDSESVRPSSQKVSSAVHDSSGHGQISHHSKVAKDGKAVTGHPSSHKKRPSSEELSSEILIQSPTSLSEPKARSNRGFERRPSKHSSDSQSRSGRTEPSKPPRVGNIPSLVPKPPATSLVKQVGKTYSLKCRFCEEVFQGPLSIQVDWVMHLQQHILKLKKDQSTSSSSPQPLVALKHHC